jgi:hypothetical protein
MEQLSRRSFVQNLLGSLLTFSLIKNLNGSDALGGPVKPIAGRWLMEVEQMSGGLRSKKLKPVEWQQQIEALFNQIDFPDLLRAINYTELSKNALFPDDHDSALPLEFPQVEGLPSALAYVPFFIALKKGRAIVPHAHHNMTSMHMVLDGKVQARHFDRVSDETNYLTIKPTLDKEFGRGELSTVSDENNNIHWFEALSESVFIFSVAVFKVNPGEDFTGRDYIDPRGGEKIGNDLIRARRIGEKEARSLYGKS